jgi:predicted RNase H-like HicB family nuclease
MTLLAAVYHSCQTVPGDPRAARRPCSQFTGWGAIVRCEVAMHNESTAVFERDGDWYVAYCPEIPEANGQGRTKEDARASLARAIALILDDRREDGLRGLPPDAERETVVVK